MLDKVVSNLANHNHKLGFHLLFIIGGLELARVFAKNDPFPHLPHIGWKCLISSILPIRLCHNKMFKVVGGKHPFGYEWFSRGEIRLFSKTFSFFIYFLLSPFNSCQRRPGALKFMLVEKLCRSKKDQETAAGNIDKSHQKNHKKIRDGRQPQGKFCVRNPNTILTYICPSWYAVWEYTF